MIGNRGLANVQPRVEPFRSDFHEVENSEDSKKWLVIVVSKYPWTKPGIFVFDNKLITLLHIC